MCLRSQQRVDQPYATTAYKVMTRSDQIVERDGSRGPVYHSIFAHCQYHAGQWFQAEPEWARPIRPVLLSEYGFHAYVHLHDARRSAKVAANCGYGALGEVVVVQVALDDVFETGEDNSWDYPDYQPMPQCVAARAMQIVREVL